MATETLTTMATPRVERTPSLAGVVLCVASGVAFGLAAVFAKESYGAGLNVSTMLATRFAIAAALFWIIVAIRRPQLPTKRVVGVCIGLGTVGYALQSGGYFAALQHMDASMVGLVLYVYPALVLVLALSLRRERLDHRKLVALGLSLGGLVLLLRTGHAGAVTTLGLLLALSAAVIYAIYITVASTLPHGLDVYVMSAIVCTGAAASIGCFGAATGSLRGPHDASGWMWVALLALIPTAVAIACFFAGLRRVGASTAAILSCVEPVVTAASAVIVYGDRLTAGQIVGGCAVLGAVVVLQARRRNAAVLRDVPLLRDVPRQ
jgi:drug/metabolite transporter (DMT)-like permease